MIIPLNPIFKLSYLFSTHVSAAEFYQNFNKKLTLILSKLFQNKKGNNFHFIL